VKNRYWGSGREAYAQLLPTGVDSRASYGIYHKGKRGEVNGGEGKGNVEKASG